MCWRWRDGRAVDFAALLRERDDQRRREEHAMSRFGTTDERSALAERDRPVELWRLVGQAGAPRPATRRSHLQPEHPTQPVDKICVWRQYPIDSAFTRQHLRVGPPE